MSASLRGAVRRFFETTARPPRGFPDSRPRGNPEPLLLWPGAVDERGDDLEAEECGALAELGPDGPRDVVLHDEQLICCVQRHLP